MDSLRPDYLPVPLQQEVPPPPPPLHLCQVLFKCYLLIAFLIKGLFL